MKKRNKIEKAKLMVVRKHWFQQGELAERERIIKLLENQHNFDQIFLDAVDQVIALIEGESSEREDN
jgi:hypothetical protein